MNFQTIINSIEEAKKNNLVLSTQQTIEIFTTLKKISVEKRVLEKAITLLFVINKKLNKDPKLTNRETQVFNCIGLGFSSKEIASMLSIKKDTVATHRKNIIKKLNLTGTGKLQEVAFRHAKNSAKCYS